MDVYPNPSKGIVNFRYEQTISGNVEITVLDVRGQLVAKKSVSNSDDAFISISTNSFFRSTFTFPIPSCSFKVSSMNILQDAQCVPET